MKSLGISLTEIGIQFAVTPLVCILATPLIGILADKMGNFKKILILSLILCAILANFILLVPKIKIITECQDNNQFLELTCPSNDDDLITLKVPDCFESTIKSVQPIKSFSSSLNLISFDDCFLECSHSTRDIYCFSDVDQRKNQCYSASDPGNIKPTKKRNFDIQISINADELNGNENNGLLSSVINSIKFENQTYYQLSCKPGGNGCTVNCPVTKETKLKNHSLKLIADPASRWKTFWMYLLFRVSLYLVIATEMSLLKAAILTIVDKHDSEYGFQRLWAMISVCLVIRLKNNNEN